MAFENPPPAGGKPHARPPLATPLLRLSSPLLSRLCLYCDRFVEGDSCPTCGAPDPTFGALRAELARASSLDFDLATALREASETFGVSQGRLVAELAWVVLERVPPRGEAPDRG